MTARKHTCREQSVTPVQQASVAFKVCLSEERAKVFQACLALFHRAARLKFRMCLRLLGLMASALVVVPLGQLYMRPCQKWVTSLKINPTLHSHRYVQICTMCTLVLCPWKRKGFLNKGVTIGTVLVSDYHRCLSIGLGRFEGRTVNGTGGDWCR